MLNAQQVNYIISGTFSGKVKTQDGKDELEITNGKFDINKTNLPIKE